MFVGSTVCYLLEGSTNGILKSVANGCENDNNVTLAGNTFPYSVY